MKGIILTLLLFILPLVCKGHPHAALGRHQMVVSAQHLATRVGNAILHEDGNAIDAAVAMGYALAVVHPCCGNLGGGGFMLLHLANGENVFINFREKAPQNIKVNMLVNNKRETVTKAYKTVAVPGSVMGLNKALEKYGTMSLDEVIAPAIYFAEKGYRLTRDDIQFLNYDIDVLEKNPITKKIFTKHGTRFRSGDTFVQKQLAEDLKIISEKGTEAFYKGKIAKKTIAAMKKHHGVLTQKDLTDYNITMQKPIVCHYRGYDIITSPPPSSGGIAICEMLNIASTYSHHFGYRGLSTLQHNIEAMRHTYQDKLTYIGDPKFVNVPTQKLISMAHAQKIRQHIIENQAGHSESKDKNSVTYEGRNTTSYVVVDRWGNVAVVTYSINDFFGARVIPEGTGFLLNSQLEDFTLPTSETVKHLKNNPNRLEPGKRPVSSIAPTIVMRNGEFVMALSTPGGPTIPTQLVGVIENVIDRGMSARQAVDTPRYHMQWWPDVVYLEKDALSRSTVNKLKRMGYKTHRGSPLGFPYWGGVVLVVKGQFSGLLEGAMDSRRPGGMAMGG